MFQFVKKIMANKNPSRLPLGKGGEKFPPLQRGFLRKETLPVRPDKREPNPIVPSFEKGGRRGDFI
jgi:hypothetical protein